MGVAAGCWVQHRQGCPNQVRPGYNPISSFMISIRETGYNNTIYFLGILDVVPAQTVEYTTGIRRSTSTDTDPTQTGWYYPPI